jgi:hypothetical protein
MRTDSDRNLSAEADPNPARKTRERVLTKKQKKSDRGIKLSRSDFLFHLHYDLRKKQTEMIRFYSFHLYYDYDHFPRALRHP